MSTNRLRNRFIGISAAIGLLTVGISYTGYWTVEELSKVMNEQTIVSEAIRSHMEADMMHDAIRGDVLGLLLASRNGEALDGIEADLQDHVKNLQEKIAANKKRNLPDQAKKDLETLIPALNDYETAAFEMLAAAKSNYEAAQQIYPAFMDKFSGLEDGMGKAGDSMEAWSKAQTGSDSFVVRMESFLLGLFAAAVIAVLIMPYTMQIWLFKPMRKLMAEIARLSEGDYSRDVEGADRNDEIGAMAKSLNANVQKIRETVTQIKDAAMSVNAAASEIASGSSDLSMRTEQQASNLEETAASMEEITGTVKQNSANASTANELSTNASNIANEGGKVVEEAVAAMGSIERSSQKISDIITVIDEIAFQTNLLALNAAVEAARAGDAGKGFAVVASEVRALAGRSASASKEIKALINESAGQVKTGASLVNQAGETLKGIVGSVRQVAGIVSDIASASVQQSTGIDEINAAVTQMDEVTQQNAALVEENTAAAQSMLEQARSLEQLIGFFKVDATVTAAASETVTTAHTAKPAVQIVKAAPKPVKTVPVRAIPVAKAVGNQDGWEEF